jgi:competence protein ComEC
VSCDEAGCITQLAGGGLIALSLKPEALADDCERAALVVTTRQAPASCQSTVISGERLRGQAGLALWRIRDGYAVAAIRPKERDRPWAPAAPTLAGDAETDLTAAPRIAVPKPVDATPAEADQQQED